jgi:mono/diheme cytochrome c family protein
VLSCLVLSGGSGTAQTKLATKNDYERLIYSVKGPDLYRAHCAACHGSEGKGGGPVAAVLKTKVPDLTTLARNGKGEFPSARVRKIIVGEEVLISHGSREMPIWGPIFHQIESDQDFGNVRLDNLLKHMELMQQK